MARTRLTNDEFNVVTKWTAATHFDNVMDVETDDDENDFFMDYENDEELSLEDGFKELFEAIAYPFEHEGLTEDESKIMINLLEEFGVDEDMLTSIRRMNKWV